MGITRSAKTLCCAKPAGFPYRLSALVVGHEQAWSSALPHNQLARLQRRLQRSVLLFWLGPKMEWVSVPSGWLGRLKTFSLRHPGLPDTECAVWPAVEPDSGLAASLLRLAHLDRPALDYNTLCWRQKGLAVAIP